MDEEINKITLVETLIWGLFALGIDGVCILIDVTGVGVLIAPVIQGFGTFSIWLYFRGKGVQSATKLWRQVLKYAANILPATPIIITAFTVSIPFFIEVALHNNPKLGETITKAVSTFSGGTSKAVSTVASKVAMIK